MKYIHLFALLLMFVFYTSCTPKPGNVPKDNVNSEAKNTVSSYGPSTMVRNVKKGRNGSVLIAASFGGVFRYNAHLPDKPGKSFINLTSKLGSRRFWDVLEDRRGNLWFASTDSGVYYYNGKSLPDGKAGFQHFTVREGLANNAVVSIYEDKAGIIWFGTVGGISRYDGKSFRNFTTKDGLPNNSITTIMEDKTGKLWIGTSGEACFYNASLPDGKGKTFIVFRNKDGKAFNNVRGITEDRKGNIWFGASILKNKKGDTVFVENGLWRYSGNAFTKINQNSTSAIIEDKKGNIWTTGAVNPNGVGVWKLLRYDQRYLYNKNPAVIEIMSIEKMLCGILEDNDGSIWFGSLNGVYRYDAGLLYGQGKTITDFKRAAGKK